MLLGLLQVCYPGFLFDRQNLLGDRAALSDSRPIKEKYLRKWLHEKVVHDRPFRAAKHPHKVWES
jgi:hypothetical protein